MSSADGLTCDNAGTSVRVALRIRPQIVREKLELCRVCTAVTPGEPQITIGDDRSFTYDCVFDQDTHQQLVYDRCVRSLIEGTLEGFNATVLAYGQTGSGKTYTMGTAFDMTTASDDDSVGIVPRAMEHLFTLIEQRKREARERGFIEPIFDVAVQFIELYNEDLVDLLADDRSASGGLKIHEDANGEIYLNGVTSRAVASPHETLTILKNGALNRTTASTNMNEQSSRSHAIFTLMIKQQRVVAMNNADLQPQENEMAVTENANTCAASSQSEFEILTAKFHFVDLAGSERLKRTGATGDRAKEGISINCGLLALGNVISALGDVSGKITHVPYRDSKLTRLLQDSLGGNSRTLMIACVSPSDCDFVETLNTLKYANRAKNIKNKVVANQDKSSKMISDLRNRIAQLEAELADFKQGRILINEDGVETFNDQYQENCLLHADVNQLRVRVKALQETGEALRARNVQLMFEKDEALRHTEAFKRMAAVQNGDISEQENRLPQEDDAVSETIRHYLDELEKLRSALYESQATNDQLRKQINRWKASPQISSLNSIGLPSGYNSSMSSAPSTPTMAVSNDFNVPMFSQTSAIIEEARADIERMKRSVAKGASIEDESGNVETRVDQRTDGDGVANNLDSARGEEPERIRSISVPKEGTTTANVSSTFGTGNEECDTDSEYEDEMENDEAERYKLTDELVDLQSEISIKERLVMELERSERRLNEVRITYEKKLAELSLRIAATEAERDRVLSEMATKNASKLDSEHVKKIREDYERKLNEMRTEFKKLQSVEREHRKMQARQAMEQQQLMKLRGELSDMKKLKVELMQKIKEEAKKAKASELAHSKRVAGLEKESRKKDNQIKQLENRDRQREMFLKRTNDELARLREKNRQTNRITRTGRGGFETTNSASNLSSSAASNRTSAAARQAMPRTAAARARLQMGRASGIAPFSAKNAKNKWLTIEKNICRRITQRQSVTKMEEELERRMNERHALIDEIQHLEQRFIATKDLSERDLIGEQIDGCQDKMGYLQDQITELQNTIASVDSDSTKDANSSDADAIGNVETILEECGSIAEAKYLLQRLLTFSLEQGFIAAKAKSDHKESEARIQQLEKEARFNESLSLLTEVLDLSHNASTVHNANEQSKSESPEAPEKHVGENAVDAASEVDKSDQKQLPAINGVVDEAATNASFNLGEKTRRRTATPAELMTPMKASRSLEEIRELTDDNVGVEERTRSHSPTSATTTEIDAESTDSRAESVCSPSTSSHSHRIINRIASDQTPQRDQGIVEKMPVSRQSSVPYRSRIIEVASTSKLESMRQQSSLNRSHRKNGRIVPYTARTATGQRDRSAASRLLIRTHTLDGHTRAVLSVSANDTTVITGSKDRLAKLWDLERGVERCTFGLHQNNVNCVRLIPNSHLALSVSMSMVRLWDIRSEKCVYVLHSSGLATEGDAIPPSPSRQNTVPISETVINAAEPDPTGSLLFTSFCGDVRIWKVDKFASIGRLTGAAHGPRSEVSCLAVTSDHIPRVFTGSRDHYVKMYDVAPLDQCVFEARYEFSPPHYDNVTAILPYGDTLFTASKDSNIMRFSLRDMKRDHLELRAHEKWILDMRLLQASRPLLVTACKGGAMKVWDFTSTRKLRLVEELNRAHDEAINSIAVTPSSVLFTASNDTTVGLWRLSEEAS